MDSLCPRIKWKPSANRGAMMLSSGNCAPVCSSLVMPLATGKLGLNRAVKMPEAARIPRNKTACPQVPHRTVFGTAGGYRRHLHHRTLLYVSSRCQYLTHASPDYTRGIG